MKRVTKIGVWVVLVTMLFSCNGKKSFTLTCNVDGTNAKEAYLKINDYADTVEVENGAFVFKGSVEEPTLASLSIEGKFTNLMIENVDMTFEAAVEVLQEAAITGSESQLVYDEYMKGVITHRSTRDEYMAFCTSFINDHLDSYFTPYLIMNLASMMKLEEVNEMVESLSAEVKAGKIASDLSTQIKAAMSLKVGGTVPDFTMNNEEGNPVTLSQVYPKVQYLLIDFWASWCAPCRAENPNVVENYKKYHDKGFEIVAVSLDKDKDSWLKAIENQELIWIHVSDLKGWKNEVAKQYAIRSVPSNFLIDSEGKIIARNLRGKDLGEKLSELLD